jgi:hypothetical protein
MIIPRLTMVTSTTITLRILGQVSTNKDQRHCTNHQDLPHQLRHFVLVSIFLQHMIPLCLNLRYHLYLRFILIQRGSAGVAATRFPEPVFMLINCIRIIMVKTMSAPRPRGHSGNDLIILVGSMGQHNFSVSGENNQRHNRRRKRAFDVLFCAINLFFGLVYFRNSHYRFSLGFIGRHYGVQHFRSPRLFS